MSEPCNHHVERRDNPDQCRLEWRCRVCGSVAGFITYASLDAKTGMTREQHIAHFLATFSRRCRDDEYRRLIENVRQARDALDAHDSRVAEGAVKRSLAPQNAYAYAVDRLARFVALQ